MYPGVILEGSHGGRTRRGHRTFDAGSSTASIGAGARVEQSTVTSAVIGDEAVVGPFAVIGAGARVAPGAVTGPFFIAQEASDPLGE